MWGTALHENQTNGQKVEDGSSVKDGALWRLRCMKNRDEKEPAV